MGSDKDVTQGRFRRNLDGWQIPALLLAVATTIALTGSEGRELLRYDRDAVAAGEVWRLVTGHVVHLSPSHLILNGFGLCLVWYLVADSLDLRRWLVAIAISLTGIDLGLWIFETELHWYVGLSGLLHGLLLAGALAGWSRRPLEASVIVLAVAAKLAFEQLSGPMPGSLTASGGPVITAAHLYGAAAGALIGVAFAVRRAVTPL